MGGLLRWSGLDSSDDTETIGYRWPKKMGDSRYIGTAVVRK